MLCSRCYSYKNLTIEDLEDGAMLGKQGGKWRCLGELDGRPILDADTEADSRAKMLIYLIENKLIDVKNLCEIRS